MEKLYPVLGHSMRPLLEPGEAVAARHCAPGELRAGDIALLVRWKGGVPAGYVLHRVLLNLSAAGGPVVTKGDGNFLPDWPPSDFQPAGVAAVLLSGGRRRPLRRGLWPSFLLPFYSLAAGKSLYLAGAAAARLMALACRLPPRFAGPALNALYLAWEARLYPALLRTLRRPALPAGEAGAAASPVRSGRISSDETWSGTVTVADYLTVEPGASVTVLPGTRVLFERREPWFFPVIRAGDAAPVELESGGAKLLVYGSLRAAGTEAEPVFFGGPAFAGIHALGSSVVELGYCRLEGSAAAAVSARDSARLEAQDCRFSGCSRGAEAAGTARLRLAGLTLERCAGPAFLAGDRASLAVSGSRVSGPGPAAELCGAASAGFSGFSASDCERGLTLTGSASAVLHGCEVISCSGMAADCAGSATLQAYDCRFADNPAGLRLTGSAFLSMWRCRLEAGGGPALQLYAHSAASLSNCSFRGAAGPALQSLGHCSVTLDGCEFSGGESACAMTGRGRLDASGCSFSGMKAAALRLTRTVRCRALACIVKDCMAGLMAEDCSFLEVADSSFAGLQGPAVYLTGTGLASLLRTRFIANGVGVHLAGSVDASLRDCSFEAQRAAPLIISGRAAGRSVNSSFAGNSSGAAFSGRAAAELAGCVFSANGGPAFELSGDAGLEAASCSCDGGAGALAMEGRASARLSACRLSGGAKPAAALGGSAFLSASGSAFTSDADALYCRGAASLELERSVLAAGAGAALDFGGRRAELRSSRLSGAGGLLLTGGPAVRADGLEVSAADYAADQAGGTLLLIGSRCYGGARGGVLIRRGAARISSSSVDGAPYPGLAAGRDASLRCRAVTYNGAAWRPPAAGAGPRRLRRALAAFAAATARAPLFSGLYRLYYLAGARAAALLLGPGPGGAVYLYRGMASAGWEPGLSDMDLAVLTPDLSPEGDRALYSSLRARLRVLRSAFPFTGEVLTAPARDFSAFVAGWGIKGSEFGAASRLLAGAPAAVRAPAGGARADLTEAYYAYTLLLGHYLDRSLPPAFRNRNCLKGFVDVRRYLDAASPVRAARAAYAAAAGLDLASVDPGAAAEAAYGAFAALHRAAPPCGAGVPAPVPPSGWFNSHAFAAACEELRAAAGCDAGVALDSLYRVYLVLPDAAAGDREAFARAAAALRGAGNYFSASPLILTRSSFAALCALPYLNNPAFALDLARPAAGTGPADGGVFCWNLALPPQLPPDREAAILAARHFSASWRSLWEEMPPHYFYTRACGLRLLLEKGRCGAFSDAAALGAEHAAAFGGPSWREFLAAGRGRAAYEFTAARCRALREAALEA